MASATFDNTDHNNSEQLTFDRRELVQQDAQRPRPGIADWGSVCCMTAGHQLPEYYWCGTAVNAPIGRSLRLDQTDLRGVRSHRPDAAEAR